MTEEEYSAARASTLNAHYTSPTVIRAIYIEPGCERETAPYDLFACGYAPYLLEGIRLRYPEYCREQTKTKELPPER